jgi:hypothetical protein
MCTHPVFLHQKYLEWIPICPLPPFICTQNTKPGPGGSICTGCTIPGKYLLPGPFTVPNSHPTSPFTPRKVCRPCQLTCALTSRGFRGGDRVEGIQTRGYQQYHGFCTILRDLWYGYGYKLSRVRYTRVRVRCAKTRPAVYPC